MNKFKKIVGLILLIVPAILITGLILGLSLVIVITNIMLWLLGLRSATMGE